MIKFLPILLAAVYLNTCADNPDTTTNDNAAQSSTAAVDSSYPPVEKSRPNTDYKPAFAGQTRIAGVRTTTPYEATRITTNLKQPWGIDQLPDGRFIITQKAGSMVIATKDGAISEPISGIPAVDAKGQGGLLDVTLDPDFSNNRMVYWSFSERVQGGNHTAVAKGKLSEDLKRMEDVQVIYRALPTYNGDKHYGSRIVVSRDGNLFISTGERSDLVTRPQAQQLNSALGKVIRVTKDGKPVEGNPFLQTSGAKPEIYTYGHRNIQGMALHPETGQLWLTEMGPRGGDELNLIEAGKNYGWPDITYGIEYSGAKISGGATQKAGMEQPVYYWDPVLSPSGMTFYKGNTIPEWQNNLFIGGLSSKHIARIVIRNSKVVGEERLLADEGQRFRDVMEGMDGALYAVTDEGRLYRIGKK